MKIMYLAGLMAAVGLAGCEKTEVNPPPTVVTPAVVEPAATTTTTTTEVVPVPVPGPPGPAGEKGDKGDPGSTTVIVPEPAPPRQPASGGTPPPVQ